MKLVIFAATGGIGRLILRQAVAAGHDVTVTAVVRAPVPSPARPDPPRFDAGDGFFMRHLFSPLTKAALRRHYADLARMEDVLRDSGLDWTIVRPPRLTDQPQTGRYRTSFGQNLRRGFFISRADVAELMLRVIEQPESIRQTIGIAN